MQLFMPALMIAAAALAIGGVLREVGGEPFGGSFARIGDVVRYGGMGVAIAMLSRSFWRLWRWERGLELQCPCGGLLSAPLRGRDGHYRSCLGCRRRLSEP